MFPKNEILKAADWILSSSKLVAFTGAGISVESGIPPFRGENGLWAKYDPVFLDIDYFNTYPKKSWEMIKKIFYDFFGEAKPNAAHYALAEMEKLGYLDSIITQNIDNLHQKAGSKKVYEFHGNSRELICVNCGKMYSADSFDLEYLPPLCRCGGVLKPNFVFFREPIPEYVLSKSLEKAHSADLFLLIGTTGEIMPASSIPYIAKENGAKIVEINVESSNYTNSITDLFIRGKATEIMSELLSQIKQGIS